MCRKMNHAEFKHLSEKDREGRSPKSKNGDIPSQLIAFCRTFGNVKSWRRVLQKICGTAKFSSHPNILTEIALV